MSEFIARATGVSAASGFASAVGAATSEATGTADGRLVVTATANVRRNLSTRLLVAARDAARKVHDVERENDGKPIGDWYVGISANVPIAVVMAAASMEALANEIIKNYLDDPSKHQISDARQQLLKDLLQRRVGQPREKFQQIALIIDRRLDTGLQQWNDVRLLQSVRSMFMHFKPVWDNEPVPDQKAFSAVIQRVGAVSRIFPNEYPDGLFTYRVARWAVQTVPAFSAHFSLQLGLEDTFGRGQDWSLPDATT